MSCLALNLSLTLNKEITLKAILKMAQKMTQSEINALAEDSELDSSAFKDSQLDSRVRQQSTHQTKKDYQHFEESNPYGDEEFEDFEESKKASLAHRSAKPAVMVRGEKSSVYDSYANEEFDSYEESRRTKEFERSEQQNANFTKKPQAKQLKPIQENPSTNKSLDKKADPKATKKSPDHSKTSIPKAKNNNLIATSKQPPRPKTKPPLITSTDFNQNKNLPYNYNRLQERQKELLMTSLSEENKKLRQLNAQKDKELATVKGKYNILLEEKAHVLGNAKQATLKKQLEELHKKYDALMKEKAKQRSFKTVSNQMSKTSQNFVSQSEAEQREQQLLMIIEKLKQRLVSTDKQLKTLQQKMNEGLDYQEELHRKLKRVEQLEFRMDKMKAQAQEDRALIEMLKEKTNEQKGRMQELYEQKNELSLCLKRADMNQATQSDLRQELQEARRQKQLLQKSLKEMSMNFSANLMAGNKKAPKAEIGDMIEDSGELLSHKK